MNKLTLAILSILLVLSLVLQGCSSSNTTTTQPSTGVTSTTTQTAATTTAPTTSTAQTTSTAPATTTALPTSIVPQGDLVVVDTNLGTEVWAPDVGSTRDHWIVQPVYETLVYVNKEGTPFQYMPRLADSWTMSADGTTWDFYLHKGIQWQGGYGEFTANDVKYSLELIGKSGSTSTIPIQVGPDKPVKAITAVDQYHVKIEFYNAFPLLLFYLCDMNGYMVSKNYFETKGHDYAMKHPVGTGPYQFVDYQPANYIKFEAVSNHWRQTAAYKTITFKAVPELSARLAMLETGQADIGVVPPDRVNEVKAAGLNVKTEPGSNAFTVALGGSVLPTRPNYDPTCPWVYDSTQPWTSDQNKKALLVRQALAAAINKDAIISKILNGIATPTPLRDWPMGNEWSRSSWTPYPYDPGKAKQLLAQAGYSNGFSKPITMYSISGGGSPLHPAINEAVANDWQAIGIKSNIVPVDWPVLRAKTSARDTAWAAYATGFTTFLEPWIDPTFCVDSRTSFNEGFESPELDKLLDSVKTTLDLAQRQQAALTLGDFLYNQIVEIGIATAPASVATSSKVGTWQMRYLPGNALCDFEYISKK